MKKILLIAGEVSADQHGADLIRELQQTDQKLSFHGIGGDMLHAGGMELFYHSREMAFLGLTEVIKHLPFIRKVLIQLLDWCRKEKPSAAILIDYPGFNLKLAASLHNMGIPVIYYISPQLWAWGRRRIGKIRRYVDKMLVLFPFEKEFYARHGIEAEYVGHPMVDKHRQLLPGSVKRIDPGNVKIGLLPGSRGQEVTMLLPRMVETARRMLRKGTIRQAEVVCVSHIPKAFYQSVIGAGTDHITLAEGPLNLFLPTYDAVMVASGTATLEAGYFGVPSLVVYHVNPLTYWLGRLLVRIEHIGLINIVAEEEVAPELIQHDFTAQKAEELLIRMLDPVTNYDIRTRMEIIRDKLGEPGASRRAAVLIYTFIQNLK